MRVVGLRKAGVAVKVCDGQARRVQHGSGVLAAQCGLALTALALDVALYGSRPPAAHRGVNRSASM